MSSATAAELNAFFKTWEAACHRKDFTALQSLFASEGVVFRSPAVHKPYSEVNEILSLLQNVLHIIDGFHYTHTYATAPIALAPPPASVPAPLAPATAAPAAAAAAAAAAAGSSGAGVAVDSGMAWVFAGAVTDAKGKRLRIEGVDFVSFRRENGALKLATLTVMFRPLNATVAFAKAMGKRLAQQNAAAAGAGADTENSKVVKSKL